MSLIEIFSIIIIHWIADFIMQDEKWAVGKSKNWSDLLNHTYTYSVVWFAIGVIYISCKSNMFNDMTWYSDWSLTIFVLITFIAHTATDYFTSKIVSKRFKNESAYNLKLNSDWLTTADIISNGNDNNYIVLEELTHNKSAPTYQDFGNGVIGSSYTNVCNEYKVKPYNQIPNFGAFTIIGFDQVLHYMQLFTTYYFLST